MTTNPSPQGRSYNKREAEELGAFEDDALTESDALESQQREQKTQQRGESHE